MFYLSQFLEVLILNYSEKSSEIINNLKVKKSKKMHSYDNQSDHYSKITYSDVSLQEHKDNKTLKQNYVIKIIGNIPYLQRN